MEEIKKDELLNFIMEVFRDIENSDLSGCSYSIERGVGESYTGKFPTGEMTVRIDYNKLPKKKI